MTFQKITHLLYSLVAVCSMAIPSTVLAADYDALLREALSRSDAGASYAYDVLYEKSGVQAYIHVDPSRNAGERVTVTSPPESTWDAEFAIMLNEMDEEAGTQFWCSDFVENVPESATVVEETDSTVTFEYEPLPVDEDDDVVMPHLTGRITVSRIDPAIVSVQMYAERPFAPMILGRFDRFEFDVLCGRLPDGRSHVQRVAQLIQGKIATESINEAAVWQLLEYREIVE